MTTNQISQKDINAAAWAACDTFRGVVNPAQYKDYILVMLFLKYLSDVWKEHYKTYQKKYNNDEERIQRQLKREEFILPTIQDKGGDFLADFYSLYERRHQDNIGELINIVLQKIEDTNHEKLENVFRNIDFNSEPNLGQTRDRNRRLQKLLEDFHKPQLNMSPSRVSEDIIGNTYIYLIERFASDAGKKAGEFFTPLAVTKLVAQLADPKPGNTICDPTCGAGGLLIETARAIGGKNFALHGQESNGDTWALCRMNMFLHRIGAARIEWGDTLNNPLLVEKDQLLKYDRVVANPPFSLDKWGKENADGDPHNRFWRGVPPASKADWAFISHMVETAKPQHGRIAVVAPHGVLFRGSAEGRIRQQMIEENLLDAVVGLPGNLFPSTSIPVAILVFDRAREHGGIKHKQKDVLFIDASRNYIAGKNQNTLSDEQIEKIIKTYQKRSVVEKYAHLAPTDEIAENDYNLNIPRYVDTFEEEAEIDIDAVQQEIDTLEAELVKIRKEMATLMKKAKR